MEIKSESKIKSLLIHTKIWWKDTEDLFDFEAEDLIENDITIDNITPKLYLLSQQNNIIPINSLQEVLNLCNENATNLKVLSEISFNKNRNIVQIANPFLSKELQSLIKSKSQLKRTWKISPKKADTEIKVGDIIKLGRVRLKFDEICIGNSSLIKNNDIKSYIKVNHTLNTQGGFFGSNLIQGINDNSNYIGGGNTITNINNSIINEHDDSKVSNKENIERKVYCRICYCSESDLNDPLVSPCKCTGSMNYIHYKCLKQAIDSKMTKKIEDNYKFFIWKSFECEICKMEYPKYLKYKNSLYPLVELNLDYSEYVICDYALYDDSKKRTFRKGVLGFRIDNEEEISIGRTQNNKIKLKDISVSRVHCTIKRKNNKVYVSDKGSKFGTLIYVNKDISLAYNDNNTKSLGVDLIAGKQCFSINLQRACGFLNYFLNFNCCHCRNNGDNDFVIDEEEEFDKNRVEALTVVGRKNDDSYEDYILEIGTICKDSKIEK